LSLFFFVTQQEEEGRSSISVYLFLFSLLLVDFLKKQVFRRFDAFFFAYMKIFLENMLCNQRLVKVNFSNQSATVFVKRLQPSKNVTAFFIVKRGFASPKKSFTGVDEAGLGPILGPLAIARVTVAGDSAEGFTQLFKVRFQKTSCFEGASSSFFPFSPSNDSIY
jgi:hypothetical protein